MINNKLSELQNFESLILKVMIMNQILSKKMYKTQKTQKTLKI